MKSECAGFIGAGGDDSPATGFCTDYYGLPFQVRIVALFHRCVERVEIDMKMYALHD